HRRWSWPPDIPPDRRTARRQDRGRQRGRERFGVSLHPAGRLLEDDRRLQGELGAERRSSDSVPFAQNHRFGSDERRYLRKTDLIRLGAGALDVRFLLRL